MYDGVLSVEFPEDVSIVGIADDLAVMGAGTTPQQRWRNILARRLVTSCSDITGP